MSELVVRALMDDGKIVDLVKECACLTHGGSHWLHVNQLRRQANIELLEIEARSYNPEKEWIRPPFLGYFVAERARLEELAYQMHKRGVKRFLDPVPGEPQATEQALEIIKRAMEVEND